MPVINQQVNSVFCLQGKKLRSRWGRAWSKTLGVVVVVKEDAMTTTLVVTAISVVFIVSTRQIKLSFVPM